MDLPLNFTPAFNRLPAELLIKILEAQHSAADEYAGPM